MATWYRIGKTSVRIEPVEVERHTEAFVFLSGRAQRRHTSYDCYFQTWAEARQRLIDRHRLNVQSAEAHLRTAQNDLQAAIALARAPRIEFGSSLAGARE